MLLLMPHKFWTRVPCKVVAAALLIVVILAAGIVLYQWGWKTLIGWRALVDYINPKGATQKKEALQVYAVIVAGLIASITAAVGLANLYLTRKNLEQQRELEAQRAQGTALQAYYEQIGKLITDNDSDLLNTQRKEIRELARGQTLTVLQEVDAKGKARLLTFLHAAGLIEAENPAVALTGADLRGADLLYAILPGADLQKADLQKANLQKANLQKANLQKADLRGARELTQEQIRWMIGRNDTVLPQGLQRPMLWRVSSEHQRRLLQMRLDEDERRSEREKLLRKRYGRE
jgi:type II secretory pathway pseudopilin PulG